MTEKNDVLSSLDSIVSGPRPGLAISLGIPPHEDIFRPAGRGESPVEGAAGLRGRSERSEQAGDPGRSAPMNDKADDRPCPLQGERAAFLDVR